ncbi:MAG: acyl-CoA thioesterase, partial [Candidatus Nanopelagicales bacterium]
MGPMAAVEGALLREFPVRQLVTTRWADNDMYGHVNNAVYYAYFDAAINSWISEH